MAFKVLASTENMPYAEWLEWRKKGIGGSDASVVCGISRYKSPVELWLDKTDQIQSAEAGEAASTIGFLVAIYIHPFRPAEAGIYTFLCCL